MRCPRPWRARNATRFPSTVPMTILSEGFPNGVLTANSRPLLRPFIEYKPLPPMTPMVATGSFARADFPLAFLWTAICFSRELPVQIHRFDFDLAAAVVECGRRDLRIVAENDDPVSIHHSRQPGALGFERLHRIQVIRHDPGQGNMVPRREQIRNKSQCFSAAGEQDSLDIGVVARNARNRNAR